MSTERERDEARRRGLADRGLGEPVDDVDLDLGRLAREEAAELDARRKVLRRLAADLYRLEWDADLYATPRGWITFRYERRADRLLAAGWTPPTHSLVRDEPSEDEQAVRTFGCMFHDEQIPDAPCNCDDPTQAPLGFHPIVPPRVTATVERLHGEWRRMRAERNAALAKAASLRERMVALAKAVADVVNAVVADHPMWIGDDEQPLDYLPKREALISDFVRECEEAIDHYLQGEPQ